MKIYTVDFRKFIHQLLPPSVRKPIMLAFLFALIRPIRDLYQQFTSFHQSRRKDVSISGQVIKLEWLLNDRFNAGQEGIWIVHNTPVQEAFFLFDEGYTEEGTLIYDEADGRGPYMYEDADMVPADVNFIVLVPEALEFDEFEMRAVVDKKKLYGSTYSIQRYS